LVLGDRFEIFAAAAAAMVAGLPIAHLHGGESSEGAFDEAIRHSITKMSHLHLVAAEPYRQRVIQLGEHPSRVFDVGGLGVDGIRRVRLLGRDELQASLAFEWRRRNLMVTFHPVTLEEGGGLEQFDALLDALHELGDDTGLIFTGANADTGGRSIAGRLLAFVQAHPNARAYESLGQQRYLSALNVVDGVVGNSSSGLAEAPTFGKPTLNIGDRQRGRLRAASVIDAAPDLASIRAGLATLFSDGFRAVAAAASNPYGDGGASARIVEVLRTHPLDAELLKKPFYDLPLRRNQAP
jgi:GDP/UDP-N,N'-diacetylbacillosamine 2-epimerase (hydrolysing)